MQIKNKNFNSDLPLDPRTEWRSAIREFSNDPRLVLAEVGPDVSSGCADTIRSCDLKIFHNKGTDAVAGCSESQPYYSIAYAKFSDAFVDYCA